jgi:hypothetical protein
LISENFQIENNKGNTKGIDETLNAWLKGQKDIREFIEKFDETIQLTCKETLNTEIYRTHLQRESQSLGGQTLSQHREKGQMP